MQVKIGGLDVVMLSTGYAGLWFRLGSGEARILKSKNGVLPWSLALVHWLSAFSAVSARRWRWRSL